jgi:hypothetical protein
VAAPVPPLDHLARRRLVQSAPAPRAEPRATPVSTRRGTWLTAAAAVVALLVVVAVGAMVLSNDDSPSETADTGAGGSASVAERAPTGNIGEVGDVTDPDALRALLQGRDEEKAAQDSDADANSAPPAAAGSGTDDAPEATGGALDAARQSANFRASVDTCAAQLAGSRPVRFVGTGTFEGRAVAVVGLDSGGRTIAFVVPLDACTTVLASVSR